MQIGDPLKNYVLRWDGTNWSTLDGGVNGNVMAIAADESNVYLGGYFDTAGTNMSVRFAQYRIDTEVNNPEKIDPVVVWDNPSALTYGTPLGSAQLSAQAEVAGEMSYYPPAGTVLPVGNQQPLQVVKADRQTVAGSSVAGGYVSA